MKEITRTLTTPGTREEEPDDTSRRTSTDFTTMLTSMVTGSYTVVVCNKCDVEVEFSALSRQVVSDNKSEQTTTVPDWLKSALTPNKDGKSTIARASLAAGETKEVQVEVNELYCTVATAVKGKWTLHCNHVVEASKVGGLEIEPSDLGNVLSPEEHDRILPILDLAQLPAQIPQQEPVMRAKESSCCSFCSKTSVAPQ